MASKKIVIGAILVILIAGLVLFNAEVSKQVTQVLEIATEIKQVTIPQTYNCAQEMDKLISYSEKLQSGQQTANPYKEATEIYNEIQSQNKDILDHRCWITIESWAHESQYESLLWSMPWEKMSYDSQVILGEIECDTKQCEKTRNTYADNTKGLK